MSPERKVRVLIIDDHRLMRDGLRSLLERGGETEVVGEAADARQGIALAARLQPQVILLDIHIPGINGIQALYRLAKRAPAARVLLVSGWADEEYVREGLGPGGAAGYLLKSDAADELLSAIRALARGKRYISPAVASIVLEQGMAAQPSSGLTRREREVLRLIAEGTSAKAIAQALEISPKTVQVHRTNLAAKLGIRSTAALVRYAIKHKLVKLA